MKSITTTNVQFVDLVFWPVWGLGRFTHLEQMQDELSIKISDEQQSKAIKWWSWYILYGGMSGMHLILQNYQLCLSHHHLKVWISLMRSKGTKCDWTAQEQNKTKFLFSYSNKLRVDHLRHETYFFFFYSNKVLLDHLRVKQDLFFCWIQTNYLRFIFTSEQSCQPHWEQ